MIKIEELRIGNFVMHNNEITEIYNIISDYNGVNMHMDYLYYIEISELKPIPLTEEILLNCGFIKGISEPKHYHIKGMMIYNIQGMFINVRTDVRLKHLHQLQNLYFALTNQELNIEL